MLKNKETIVTGTIIVYPVEFVETVLKELQIAKNKIKKLENTIKVIGELVSKENFAEEMTVEGLQKKFSWIISTLGLTTRSNNCLVSEGIVFVGDLIKKSEVDLLKTQHLGKKSIDEIKKALTYHGLHLEFDCGEWKRPVT